jgi:gamma-tubulin complex component 5
LGGGVGGEGAVDEEFFVEDNGVGIVDPDFWAEGFGLRDGIGEGDGDGEDGEETAIPVFLAHVARDVLGSGKATGLLRALGATDADIHVHQFTTQSFSDLLALHTARPNPGRNTDDTHRVSPSVSLSTDTLSRVVYDELQPHCEATSALLASVLVDDCGLWRHLGAIEDLYLMRRGDAMSHFTDVLFAKVRFLFSVYCPFTSLTLMDRVYRWTANNHGATSTF